MTNENLTLKMVQNLDIQKKFTVVLLYLWIYLTWFWLPTVNHNLKKILIKYSRKKSEILNDFY